MRFFSIVKKHWLAIFVALVIATLIVLPTVVSIIKMGDTWQGIYPFLVDDELHYLALTREIYDGHLNLGNVFLKEYKDVPYLQQPLAEIFFTDLAKLLGISIPDVFAISKFIFPFIGFLVLYNFILLLTKSRLISVITSAAFYSAFLYSFGRPINPQFSFILFIACLCLVYKIISQEWSKTNLIKLNISLAFVFGILFYIYPYHWMTIVATYGLVLLFSAIRSKKWSYYIQSGLWFALPVAVIAIPYLINLLAATDSPYYQETFQRFGFIYTHWPSSFFNVGLLFLTFLALTIFRNRINSVPLQNFLYALVVGTVILNWQNVITGQNLHLSHHFYPITVLVVTVVMAVLAANLISLKSFRTWLGKFGILVILLIILLISNKQSGELVAALKNAVNPPLNTEDQRLAEVADWLNTDKVPANSAIYVLGSKLEWLVPVYTPHNLYYSSYAPMYLMSDQELEERWLIQHVFDTPEYIQINSQSILMAKFLNEYQNKVVRRKIAGWFGYELPEPILLPTGYTDRILAEHEQLKKEDFEKKLKQYTVDLLIVDTLDPRYQNLLPVLEKYSFLKLRTAINGVYIFEVK